MKDMVAKLERKRPLPEMANSSVALAYEQGSGPALLDRLEAAERQPEAAPPRRDGGKMTLGQFRAAANEKSAQQPQEKANDRDLDRDR